MKICAEYLWLDGKKPTADIRSKTKILELSYVKGLVEKGVEKYLAKAVEKNIVPVWGFDGSSTEQAEGKTSDCVLQPVAVYPDPLRTKPEQSFPHLLVLNEVFLPDGKAHSSNTRSHLRDSAQHFTAEEFWFGIEQEYNLFKDGRPLGFPEQGFPAPQGPYYCSVGAEKAFGRNIVERHMDTCLQAGLLFAGINAEVMPGQWEFQIGAGEPLKVADDLVVARWLLSRIAEEYGVTVSLAPKPQAGDWNGAGAHTNFSTKSMRENDEGFPEIIARLREQHAQHIAVYGAGIEDRLTGRHETCSYQEFRAGVSDRGASIRIPWQVARDGKGYMEDRRPCANIDPYVVLERIMRTVKG